MHPSQRDLKKLQDAIYRDKVERARKMTPEERFMEGFRAITGSIGKSSPRSDVAAGNK